MVQDRLRTCPEVQSAKFAQVCWCEAPHNSAILSCFWLRIAKSVVKRHGLWQTSGTWSITDWNDKDSKVDSVDFKNRGLALANGCSSITFYVEVWLGVPLCPSPVEPHWVELSLLPMQMQSVHGGPWTDCRKATAWRPSSWGKQEWADQHPICHPQWALMRCIQILCTSSTWALTKC